MQRLKASSARFSLHICFVISHRRMSFARRAAAIHSGSFFPAVAAGTSSLRPRRATSLSTDGPM